MGRELSIIRRQCEDSSYDIAVRCQHHDIRMVRAAARLKNPKFGHRSLSESLRHAIPPWQKTHKKNETIMLNVTKLERHLFFFDRKDAMRNHQLYKGSSSISTSLKHFKYNLTTQCST